MPGTLRYLSEYTSRQIGTNWKIYIDDDEYVLEPDDFKTVQGFRLNYPTQARPSPRESYIIPSSLSFDLINQDFGHDTLQNHLIAANEERFKILILKDDAIYWSGFVLTDNIIVVDRPKPEGFLIINAVDGLGRLKDIPYNNDGTPYTGRETLLQHIKRCFDKIPLSYFHATNDIFLRVAVDFIEDNHPTQSDPLAVTNLNHSVFHNIDEEGNYNYANCYEVLEEILKIFNARMYYADGSYIIEQVNARKDAPYTQYNYRKDFTQFSFSNLANYDTVLNVSPVIEIPLRTGGGSFTYYPPLDKVCLDYNHDTGKNLLTGISFADKYPEGSRINLGELDTDSAGERLLLSFKINFESTWVDVPNFQYYRHLLRLQIKIGNYYLKRSFSNPSNDITYGPVEWTTTPEYYDISTKYLYQEGATPDDTTLDRVLEVSFETPVLVEGGDIEINLFYAGTWTYNNVQIGTEPFGLTYAFYWSMVDQVLRVLAEGEQSGIDTVRRYCVTNNDSDRNTQTIDLKTLMGDGPFVTTFNKLKVFDGTNYIDGGNWKVGGTGTAYKIQQLVIRQILAGQKLAIKRYEGTIIGNITAKSRLEWDSAFHIFEGGTQNSLDDSWTGRWFEVAVDETNITDEPEEILESPEEIPTGPDSDTPDDDGANEDTPTTENILETVEDAPTSQDDGGIDNFGVTAVVLETPLDVPIPVGGDVTIIDPATGNTGTFTVVEPYLPGSGTIIVQGENLDILNGGSSVVIQPGYAYLFQPGSVPAPYQFSYTQRERVTKTFVVSHNTPLSASQQAFFWRVPSYYNGYRFDALMVAVNIAGTGSNTNWTFLINNVSALTGVILDGETKSEEQATEIILNENDILKLNLTAVSSTPPSGLVLEFLISGDNTVYGDQFTYNYNSVLQPTNTAHLRHLLDYAAVRKIAGSLFFDGTSYLSLGDTSSFNTQMEGNITLTVWVYFEDITANTGTIISRFDGTNGWRLHKTATNIVFQVGTQSTATIAVSDMKEQQWHHVAVRFFPGANCRIYLDATLQSSQFYGTVSNAAVDMEIAAYNSGTDKFSGYLSMLRIYSYVVEVESINTIKDLKHDHLPETLKGGLFGSWELYDFSGGVAPDQLGGLNATETT